MSARKGPLEGGPLSLPQDIYHVYTRMEFFAWGAAKDLYESWQRPKRHNKRIERSALWHAVLLDKDCGQALEPDRKAVLLPPSTAVETRYELQAAVRTVHTTLPFIPLEREVLRREFDETGNTGFADEDAIRRTTLFERWHEWLWMDEQRAPITSVEALGASAILAEGCARLRNITAGLL
jgi:hypothetical protein